MSKEWKDHLKEAVDARICWDRTHGHGITHCNTEGCDKRSISPDYAIHEIVALRSEVSSLRAAVKEARAFDADTIEGMAAIEHERWAGWMRYLFSKCGSVWHKDGGTTGEQAIPLWAVENWTRQMNTPYADLTEKEKESDRVEVRKTIAYLQAKAASVGKTKDDEGGEGR